MTVAKTRKTKKGKKTARRVAAVAVIGALAVIAALVAGPASADTIDIPIGQTYVSGEPGSALQIGSSPVPEDLVGRTCNVVAEIANGASVHLGNTVVVTSGDSTVEITGIEDVADGVVMEGGSLTLGTTMNVSIVFGPDGHSSVGSSLSLTCEALPPAPPAPPVEAEPTYTG
ncbi:MAG: hypothetical protein OEV40_16290 [Acidimicrobiia bacterium]|nr:hypothetical protein [Acidimicrobiia bacterium]